MSYQGEYVIETSGFTNRYGSIVAVDGVSLRVPRGQVFGLLGPNGTGKTTTIGMLLWLARPTAGSVRLFGIGPEGNSNEALEGLALSSSLRPSTRTCPGGVHRRDRRTGVLGVPAAGYRWR